jgi:hypothetical protein
VCTARYSPSTATPASATGTCRARDGNTAIAAARAGLRVGKASTDAAISRKLMSMAVTRMSTPRNQSPARWQPITPIVAMAVLSRIAT